jgi:chaperonin GroEL
VRSSGVRSTSLYASSWWPTLAWRIFVIVEQIRRQHQSNYGFDVLHERYVDLREAGIIDPAKVTRTPLENAASVAGMILTTEALVTDAPGTQPAVPAEPPGPDMYG